MKRLPPLVLAIFMAACATQQQAPVIEHTPEVKKPEQQPSPPTAEKPPTPPVPVEPPKPVAEPDWRPETYIVKKGDTLHGIGLEFGFDYKDIAEWNNIQPPYVIRIGQKLRMKASKDSAEPRSKDTVATPLKTEVPVTAKPLSDQPASAKPLTDQPAPAKSSGEPPLISEPKAIKERYSDKAMAAVVPAPVAVPPVATAEKPAEAAKAEQGKPEIPKEKVAAAVGGDEISDWAWPVNGKILTGFNDASSAKGVDIAGTQGQPVYAAAAGKVVYSGSGLRGYGKLVIIKHNNTYLSAYAHNSQVLVKEGQEVAKGQKIAEMGSTDTDRVKLHFEIRKQGKPVDPTRYLPGGQG